MLIDGLFFMFILFIIVCNWGVFRRKINLVILLSLDLYIINLEKGDYKINLMLLVERKYKYI